MYQGMMHQQELCRAYAQLFILTMRLNVKMKP
ncbi:hypothetical protein SAMN06295960_3625 [Paenibacillus aquistagni]|uniref:Uncharacterized protein n=1 Tax=Paenibacillus aquistagni TaxID=1852522 RepID=A0A1X7LL46_9BACL|nr:hypothetical protein SAMN06295960_3625 [Paenibacillus aquistagni]